MLNNPIQSTWPRAIALACVVAAGTFGCADVNTYPVSGTAIHDANTEGIRFYRPHPHILMSPIMDKEGKPTGNSSYRIVYLPDFTKAYRMTMSPGFGSATMNPTLSGGWNLTGLNAMADSKTSETLTALAALIPTVLPAPAADEPQDDSTDTPETTEKKGKSQRGVPALYRIQFDEYSGEITSLKHIPIPGP
jgi:hypothetical protein